MGKATGYDDIPLKILNICSNELFVLLTALINHSFETSLFPENMKSKFVYRTWYTDQFGSECYDT